MSKRRPVYLKAVDVVALLLVGLFAVGWVANAFQFHDWFGSLLGAALAVYGIWLFARLGLAVRYLWTGREVRLRNALRRSARPASP